LSTTLVENATTIARLSLGRELLERLLKELAADPRFHAGPGQYPSARQHGRCHRPGGNERSAHATDGDGRRQRAGSLRSLNACAVGQALLLLERFVVGDTHTSMWVRQRVQRDGRLVVESPVVRPTAACATCAHRAGPGDAALDAPPAVALRARRG
jgi:hypothetical protein